MNSLTTKKGFTLIETLVGSAVFVILALSAYRAFGVLMDAVSISQAKLAATTLANEKFEIIRNLPYDDIGIENGIPAGKIVRNETITKDNYSFDVQTTIRNIDDTFDGTIGGSPSDTSPADYKSVDLDLTCISCKVFSPLKFTTLVAPHALETASSNGALFIQVFDTAGIPVPNTSVSILNTATNPDIIINEITDNTGWVKIVDVPPGINTYNIIATKSGYTEDQTYPKSGIAGENPINEDATVVLQQVTQTSLLIDRVSSLNVSSVDASCIMIPNIDFSLTGTKLIGTPSVLKYPTENFSTDSSGEETISNLEWDTYHLLLDTTAYDFAGSTLLPSFTINPGENKNLQMVVVPHLDNALLISVEDSLGNPIDGATVQLQKDEFNQNKTTNSLPCSTPGQVFWNGLVSGTYTLTISKTGYTTSVSSVDISAPRQEENITLTP
ncbi:MAG: carboxypeptidase regulatory-like domain-containing protein [Minisyncoccia bacterium]